MNYSPITFSSYDNLSFLGYCRHETDFSKNGVFQVYSDPPKDKILFSSTNIVTNYDELLIYHETQYINII